MNRPGRSESSVAQTTLIICAIVAGVIASLSLLVAARNLLPLIFGSILFAVVANRLAEVSQRIIPDIVPRSVKIMILITFITMTVLLVGFTFANSASEQIVKLTDRIESSFQQIVEAAKQQPLINRFVNGKSDVAGLLPSSAKSIGFAKGFVATAFGGITDCLILLILSIYFCFSPDKYRHGLTRLIPTSWRNQCLSLLDESATTLWRWMLGRTLAMSIVGFLFGIGLAIIGIPMALELGVFAGLVTFVPNIGGIAAVLPALLLASQQSQNAVFIVAALYGTIQFTESYLVTPLVQERQVALPPAAVILAQLVAGIVFGFWGIVFATPMVAIVQLWIRRLYVESWLEAKPSG